MTNDMTLPTVADTGRRRVSTVVQLADIPEEEIWLQKQKSARTRRAYRLDVQHFMKTLGIATPAELRQAEHKAVIAWERYMRETERAAASTIRVMHQRIPSARSSARRSIATKVRRSPSRRRRPARCSTRRRRTLSQACVIVPSF